MKHFRLVLIALLAVLSACGDFLEDDITKDSVELKAPSNGAVVNQTTLNFWWDELEGATSYSIQVASPSFDSIVNLVIDEEVTGDNKYEATLPIGNYQWKVIGKNFGYETENPMVFDLIVKSDSAGSLESSILVLISPNQDAFTNDVNLAFSWQAMQNATDYNFQLASPDFSNNSFILSNELLAGTQISKTLSEGEYVWRVRGQNNKGVSPFTERRLTVDLTSPEAPTLTSPNDGTTVPMPVLLNWTSDLNSARDTLYVFKDSLATLPVLKTALVNTEYNFSDASSNKYFWRVRTVDKAGNVSAYSALRKFFTQ